MALDFSTAKIQFNYSDDFKPRYEAWLEAAIGYCESFCRLFVRQKNYEYIVKRKMLEGEVIRLPYYPVTNIIDDDGNQSNFEVIDERVGEIILKDDIKAYTGFVYDAGYTDANRPKLLEAGVLLCANWLSTLGKNVNVSDYDVDGLGGVKAELGLPMAIRQMWNHFQRTEIE